MKQLHVSGTCCYLSRYLQPIQVEQAVSLLQDGAFMGAIARKFAVSHSTVLRGSRRQAVTHGELQKLVEGHESHRRTNICCLV